jgi:hypothetical protein
VQALCSIVQLRRASAPSSLFVARGCFALVAHPGRLYPKQSNRIVAGATGTAPFSTFSSIEQ